MASFYLAADLLSLFESLNNHFVWMLVVKYSKVQLMKCQQSFTLADL
jgi:hypothetical protein